MIPYFSREFLGLYYQFVNAFFLINILAPNSILVQVNLCQKVLFLRVPIFIELHTSSIHENYKLKPGENIQNNFCTQHVLPMFCKNKNFRQRFTCNTQILVEPLFTSLFDKNIEILINRQSDKALFWSKLSQSFYDKSRNLVSFTQVFMD